jgi:hypothetical protein
MKTTQLASGAARFAHLLGMGRLSAARAEDDDDDDDDDKKKKDKDARAEDDEEKKDASAKAEDDDADDDEDEDKKKDDDDDKDSKKAQDDDETAKAMRTATRRERARCAAIFSTPAAASRPDLAAYLAFDTGMGAKTAVALLEATTAGSGRPARAAREDAAARLDERMARVQIPNPGAADAVTGQPAVSTMAARIIAANDRRLGLTK